MPYPPFKPEEVIAIERFYEMVVKREEQIAKMSGIDGSYAKALHAIIREVRSDAAKRHYEKVNP